MTEWGGGGHGAKRAIDAVGALTFVSGAVAAVAMHERRAQPNMNKPQ